MSPKSIRLLVGVLCLTFVGVTQPGVAEEQSVYSVKASQVVVPADATLGSYRRTIQPFENWDLICDENLLAMTKICNVTQTIVDADGGLVFGWSLAATEQGEPVMIFRTRSDIAPGGHVRLQFPQSNVSVEVTGCDVAVCTGLLEVDLPLKRLIAEGVPLTVSYESNSEERVFETPLLGLNTALSAIE